MKPQSLHRELLRGSAVLKSSPKVHQLYQAVSGSNAVQLLGYAFVKKHAGQPLYVLADDGTSEQLRLRINQPIRDVKHNNKPLRAVLIGTLSQSVQIWQDPSTDG